MTTRFSYGVSQLDAASARKLADDTLEDLREVCDYEPEAGFADCCEANSAARELEKVLLRDLAGWASLLAST